jgi:hypothetical protein
MRLDWLNKYSLFTAHGRRGVRPPVHAWAPPCLISLCSEVLRAMTTNQSILSASGVRNLNLFPAQLVLSDGDPLSNPLLYREKACLIFGVPSL